MYNVDSIKNYILFLKRECGLFVTLHPYGDESIVTSSELITFNIHDAPYCIFVKSIDGMWQHCIEKQGRDHERCTSGSFCGCCYTGVREFVYPILHGKKYLGFISVSGYGCDGAESYISRVSEKYGIPQNTLAAAYGSLKRDVPEKEWVDTLIFPLCSMLELAYRKAEENAVAQNDPIEEVLRYIKRNHAHKLTLEDVCRRFGFSRSYVSHRFKQRVGLGFREYLVRLRLEDAEALLKYSNLTVTEIALSVGFGDSAYFSNVFKANRGMSPSAYRKKEGKGNISRAE